MRWLENTAKIFWQWLLSKLIELLSAIHEGDVRPVELMMSVLAITWGLWALLPWPSLMLAKQSAKLLSIAPQHVWGLLMLVIGGSQLIGMAIPYIPLRLLAAFMSMAWWLFLDFVFAWSNWHATSTPVLLIYVLEEAWLFYRIRLASTSFLPVK